MLGEIVNSGSAPALEAMMRYAGQRQRLLAHNIANIDTPRLQMADVSPQSFQRTLREAIDDRRQWGAPGVPLVLSGNSQIVPLESHPGEFTLNPDIHPGTGNILFHDRNNRDTERLMRDLNENFMAYRLASDLLKGHHDLLRAATAERP